MNARCVSLLAHASLEDLVAKPSCGNVAAEHAQPHQVFTGHSRRKVQIQLCVNLCASVFASHRRCLPVLFAQQNINFSESVGQTEVKLPSAMDIANTQHGSRQVGDKAYQAPTTLDIVDPVTIDSSESVLATEETVVGRKHVSAASHELSEPQLLLDPEPKQSQHSSDWTASSSLQPKTTTCNIQPAHRWTDNLESAILSFAVALLAVYFLVFAGLAVKNDGIEIEEGSQTEWLLQAAGYVSCAFHFLWIEAHGHCRGPRYFLSYLLQCSVSL